MNAYGPVFAELLEERLQPLDAGTPNPALRPKLEALTIERAFAHAAVRDRDMAAACLAGLYLYHDFLDESHTISQSISTSTGSYWHGIMHRREGDFDNARYWFRRVGDHPVFAELRTAAADLVAGTPLERAALWDPFGFIDLCEAAVRGRSGQEMRCRQIQAKEWQVLFDHCYRHAVGAA
jgi:hypothetical protein